MEEEQRYAEKVAKMEAEEADRETQQLLEDEQGDAGN